MDYDELVKSAGGTPVKTPNKYDALVAEAGGKAVHNESENHDFLPMVGNTLKGMYDQAGKVGHSIVESVKHPVETVKDLANTSLADIDQGRQRMMRALPIVGPHYNDLTGASPEQVQDQRQGDAQHEEEHPLGDFIQKVLPMMALPKDKMASVAIMARDAFERSLEAGNTTIDALHDAKNVAMLAGSIVGTGPAIKGAAEKVGNIAQREAQLSDATIARYRQAPEAVNATQEYVERPKKLRNLVNRTVEPIRENVSAAEAERMLAKERVGETAKTAPIELGQEIVQHLDTQQKALQELSYEAIDRLIEEGKTFPVGRLTGSITSKMNSLKIGDVPPVQGEAATAYKSLEAFKNMVKEIGANSKGGEIPATQVKKLIQYLDKLTPSFYNKAAGSFSPEAAKSFAVVRRMYDTILKDASLAPKNAEGVRVPIPGGYAEKMAELAPRTNAVNKLSKPFGDEQKALSALQSTSNPYTPAGHSNSKRLSNYDAKSGTDFNQRVREYYDKPRNELAAAEKTLAEAKAKAKEVDLLGPKQTRNRGLTSMQKGNNPDALEQLQALNPEVAQTLIDTGHLKEFLKSTANGSRKAKIGAGLGGAAGAITKSAAGPEAAGIGGVLGAGAGGALGGFLDIYGGRVVKAALDVGISLDKLAASPYLNPIVEAAKMGPQHFNMWLYLQSQKDPDFQRNLQELKGSEKDL